MLRYIIDGKIASKKMIIDQLGYELGRKSLTQRSQTGGITPAFFGFLLAGLIFAGFPAVILGRATFVARDFGLFSYPVAFLHRASFWRGELPLWNPLSCCGMPFLAQWNTLTLYPPSLIYLLLPLSWSLSLFCLLHLFWGGLGMYFLSRHWTGHTTAAAIAGVMFAFGGLNLNFVMWPSHVATFSWFPWVLWLVPKGCQNGGRNLVCGALVATLQMLAGGPETILFTWLALVVLSIIDCLSGHGAWRQIVSRLVAVALLVSLLSAAQILPFLELVTHSQRDTAYGSASWSMPIWGWANYLLPLFRATRSLQGTWFQPGQYWTSSYYVGIGTLWLAVMGAWYTRDRRVQAVGILLFVSAVLALGNEGLLYRGLRAALPVLGFVRYPVKFVILISALAPLLAARGFKALMDRKKLGPAGWSVSAITLALLILFVLVGRNTVNSAEVLLNGIGRAAFLLLTVGVVWFLMRGRHCMVLSCGLVLISWLDFLTHVPEQNPTVSPAAFTAGWARAHLNWNPSPNLGQARAMITPEAEQALKYKAVTNLFQNYALNRLGLLANCNLLDEIPQAHGFFSLVPEGVSDLIAAPYVLTDRDFTPLLDFMGVAQVNTPGQPFDWTRRPRAMPMVTIGQKPVFADERTAFAAFSEPQTDLRQTVFLPLAAQSSISAVHEPSAQIISTNITFQTITAEVTTPAPAMVVISQTFYRPWRAYVDGSRTTLWKANYGFQAVQVPSGKHQLRIVYCDRLFQVGLILSLLGTLACLALWLRARRPGPS